LSKWVIRDLWCWDIRIYESVGKNCGRCKFAYSAHVGLTDTYMDINARGRYIISCTVYVLYMYTPTYAGRKIKNKKARTRENGHKKSPIKGN